MASPIRVAVINNIFMENEQTPFFTTLQGRGLIHIEGPDRIAFLQGLVSNNVEAAAMGILVYACLLTPHGKFLHDFFIHDGGDVLLLDCEGGTRAQDLYTRLNRFRLRSKVTLSVEESHPVYAVIGTPAGLHDPRHVDMGYRSFDKPDLPERDFSVWDAHRIMLGVPDGSRDMEIEKSTLLECNLDKLNAIDWNKGCYMGQELTARMHYRGLAKKHLYPVRIDEGCPDAGTDLYDGETLIGEMRSSQGKIGLALLKDDAVQKLNDNSPLRLLG